MSKNVIILETEPEMHPRPINTLKETHDVTVVDCPGKLEQVLYQKPYDIAFLNSTMQYAPFFTAEQTSHGIHTGMFLYERYFKNMPGIKVVILSWDAKQFAYPNELHPHWKWGDNVVGILNYSNERNFLVDLVERYCE